MPVYGRNRFGLDFCVCMFYMEIFVAQIQYILEI